MCLETVYYVQHGIKATYQYQYICIGFDTCSGLGLTPWDADFPIFIDWSFIKSHAQRWLKIPVNFYTSLNRILPSNPRMSPHCKAECMIPGHQKHKYSQITAFKTWILAWEWNKKSSLMAQAFENYYRITVWNLKLREGLIELL